MGQRIQKGHCGAKSWSDSSEALHQCQTRLDIVKAYPGQNVGTILDGEGSLGVTKVSKGLKKAISDHKRLFFLRPYTPPMAIPDL